jgi:hypothetical protein
LLPTIAALLGPMVGRKEGQPEVRTAAIRHAATATTRDRGSQGATLSPEPGWLLQLRCNTFIC